MAPWFFGLSLVDLWLPAPWLFALQQRELEDRGQQPLAVLIEAIPGMSRAIFRIQREGRPDVVKDFRHRLYTATELTSMLRKAGYERIECYGDYDRRPFAIDSPLFLAHAR